MFNHFFLKTIKLFQICFIRYIQLIKAILYIITKEAVVFVSNLNVRQDLKYRVHDFKIHKTLIGSMEYPRIYGVN